MGTSPSRRTKLAKGHRFPFVISGLPFRLTYSVFKVFPFDPHHQRTTVSGLDCRHSAELSTMQENVDVL